MKKSQFQQLVKEIVAQTMQEITGQSDWSVSGDIATFENVELADGRLAGGDFQLQISKENSGIGSYEFWGQKGYERGQNYFVLEGWNLVRAWISDEHGRPIQDVNIKDPNNKPILDALESQMETNQKAVEEYVSQNQPEPYSPEPEDLPGSDR